MPTAGVKRLRRSARTSSQSANSLGFRGPGLQHEIQKEQLSLQVAKLEDRECSPLNPEALNR